MKKIIKFISLMTFTLGVGISLTIFLPALGIEGTMYAGYDISFGKELINIDPFELGSIASARLPMAPLALLAYIIPLLAGSWLIVSKRFKVVSLIGFSAAMVLLIRLPESIDIIGVLAGNETFINVEWTMRYGLIIAITLNGIAMVMSTVLVYHEYTNES